MFDFGFSELLLIGVIALVVLGPERLPKAARMAGQLVGRVQRMVGSVKQELSSQLEMDELRRAKDEFEATAHSVRDEIAGIGAQAQSDLHDISDGLSPDKRPAWERLPEQRTPADFGVDEQGKPLAQNTQSAQDAAWPRCASRPCGASATCARVSGPNLSCARARSESTCLKKPNKPPSR